MAVIRTRPHVLVTCKFDDDLIKNKLLSCPFVHYKSMEKIFDAQGHVTLKRVVRSGPKSNSFEILSLYCLPASFSEEDPINIFIFETERKKKKENNTLYPLTCYIL